MVDDIIVSEEDKELVKKRFARVIKERAITDSEAVTLVRALKEDHAWVRFVQMETAAR